MKICAVVAEYNPFHNGHLYHINEIRKNLMPHYIAAIVSGNFTQRGEAAIIDKFSRTKAALASGADIVFELPVCYSTQPAEFFALGAISILCSSGMITHLSFGTEADEHEHELIRSFSEWMHIDKSVVRNRTIGEFIKQGHAYPAACISAYSRIKSIDIESLSVLTKPNAILESAYLGALMKIKSSIAPYPVKRSGAQYHDSEIKGEIASATAIRKSILAGQEGWRISVPDPTYDILTQNANKISSSESLYPAVKVALLTGRHTIINLPDSSEEIVNNLMKSLKISKNLDELVGNTATRRYSRSRISRLLVHLLLGIDARSMESIRKKLPGYIRVLGIKKEALELLGILSKVSSIPVVVQPADFSGTKLEQYLLDKDILATDIYNSCCIGSPALIGQDYSNKFISI